MLEYEFLRHIFLLYIFFHYYPQQQKYHQFYHFFAMLTFSSWWAIANRVVTLGHFLRRVFDSPTLCLRHVMKNSIFCLISIASSGFNCVCHISRVIIWGTTMWSTWWACMLHVSYFWEMFAMLNKDLQRNFPVLFMSGFKELPDGNI